MLLLLQGVDSLYLAGKTTANAEVIALARQVEDELPAAGALGRLDSLAVAALVDRMGLPGPWTVQRGGGGYHLSLRSEGPNGGAGDISLCLAKHHLGWRWRWSSRALWVAGSGGAGLRYALELTEAVAGLWGELLERHVQRIDLAVDFSGWTPPEDIARWAGRWRSASRIVTIEDVDAEDEQIQVTSDYSGPGHSLSGLRFGRLPMQLVEYLKTAEVKVSGKLWFEDLWALAGWTGEAVWRTEARFGAEVLKQAGITWETLADHLPELWVYATDWCKVLPPLETCARAGESRGNWRKKTDPAWVAVQGAWGHARPIVRADVRGSDLVAADKLFAQSHGCFSAGWKILKQHGRDTAELEVIARSLAVCAMKAAGDIVIGEELLSAAGQEVGNHLASKELLTDRSGEQCGSIGVLHGCFSEDAEEAPAGLRGLCMGLGEQDGLFTQLRGAQVGAGQDLLHGGRDHLKAGGLLLHDAAGGRDQLHILFRDLADGQTKRLSNTLGRLRE